MVSCSSSEDDVDLGEAKTVVNMLSESVPVKLTAEQTLFVNDNNKFTMNFLKTVNEADRSGKSFIYSPLSITYVLGMVNDAATGLTEKELEETLGFHQGGIQAVNDYCKKLIDGLPKVDDKVTLNIANAIFLNKDFTLKPQFEQDMQTYYDAKAEALDFSASNTLDHINGWCKEKTNGMIPSILDDIDPLMVSYLLNAIYFKADWASKFDLKNTKNETFTPENGNISTDIPMMHQNVLISYLKTDTYSAIILPYGTGLWNMTVLLPEKGKTTDDVIKEVAQSSILNNPGWCETGGNYFEGYEVDLKLPRFETSSDTDKLEDGLIGLMKKMGINRAFEDGLAEIPNMCEVPVYVELMRQKEKIKVSEEGSEAAAVTVAGIKNFSMGSEPIEYPKATFHANRPFVYVIREQSSGVILFVGKFTGE
jgi:serpin B